MDNYMLLNPIDYGLSKRVKIVMISEGHFGILKKRKSRIIMKDGQQIMDIANNIRKVDSEIKISLIIEGAICSKTTKYLESNFINIIKE